MELSKKREQPLQLADRFIYLRKRVQFAKCTFNIDDDVPIFVKRDHESLYMNLAQLDFGRKKYRDLLWKIITKDDKKLVKRASLELDWPVIPRIERICQGPELLLDMPEMKFNFRAHCIDWSKKNSIATIYQNNLYICHTSNEPSYKMYVDLKFRPILKWNNKGDCLAVSLACHDFALVRPNDNKKHEEQVIFCCYKTCHVNAFAWMKDDTLFTACSNGYITTFENNVIKYRHEYEFYMLTYKMEFSKKETYLACRFQDDKCIYIVKIGNKKITEVKHIERNARDFAWNPILNCQLAIALSMGYIKIINVATGCTHYTIDFARNTINALTYNPISSELVVSVYEKKTRMTVIYILESSSVISDAIIWHEGIVQYLLWNSTGTDLCTVGNDEDLALWNFFGSKNKAIIKKINEKYIPFSQYTIR